MSKVFTITEGLENMGALKTGGQGSVYKARRIGPIITAVKLLPTPIHSESENDKHYADFQSEVAKLKRVSQQPNPNVVRILSSGITESGSLPYIEMEFIEGPDLEELLQPPHLPLFPIKEVMRVAEHLSNALAHCHRLGVSHGDIKSNNVKFNIHTGNYVLLDFGLAVMNDEQRRTSLRHAGAIEFMAPEQNEGRMLPQTDIYSFGIILYELLAGRVPFPLADRSERSRHEVRLHHMETSAPEILPLRRNLLPSEWNDAKQHQEMQVPNWLLDLVAICLEKSPEKRFADGVALQDFFLRHSLQPQQAALQSNVQPTAMQLENEQLRSEKHDLQRLLSQQAAINAEKEQELVQLRVALTRKDREIENLKETSQAKRVAVESVPKEKNGMRLPMILAAVFVFGTLLYMAANSLFGNSDNPNNRRKQEEATKSAATIPEKPRPVIGSYKVIADRAYFHNEADAGTRRGAYMVPSTDVINALEEKDGFVYTEFTNSRGQTSKGWLELSDLMPLAEWEAQQAVQPQPLTKIEINQQLQEARRLLEQGNTTAAIGIYRILSEQEVPEAMFEYGNRALKSEHDALDCDAGYALIEKSAASNYTPAKRTLGFLLLFGQNREVLRMSRYNHCTFNRDIIKGSRLLMQAVSEGDTTANDILTNFNQGQENGPDSTE